MKNKIKILHRGIGIMTLVAVAVCGLFCFAQPASAAPTGLTTNFSQSLSPGVDNAIPQVTSTKQVDQVLLSWPMDTVNGKSFTSGSYKLSYYIDTGKKAEFTIRKNSSGSADIWFDSLVWNGSAYASLTPMGYEVHTNVDGNGLPHFIPIPAFLDGGYNTSGLNYQVQSDGLTSPYTNLKPHFVIGPDKGFSFRYDNMEIHFLWNAADQRLYYVTNQMIPGRIFNMILEYSDDMSTPPNFLSGFIAGNLKLLTGIATNSFRAIPFANNFVTADGFCLDYDPDLRPNARYLDMGASGTDTNPGSPVNELILRFDVPKEYDVVTQTFTLLPSDPLSAHIEMSNPSSENELQITIPDLLSGTPVASINMTDSAKIKRAGLIDPMGGRFEVYLTNMNPGQLYSRVNISLTGVNLVSDVGSVPFGRVFTFLDYEIVNQDSGFFVSVKPYPGYTGYYMLMSGQPLRPSVTLFSDGKSPMLIPLTINAVNQWEAYFQILFNPEKSFTSDTSMNIYSQVLHYKADNGKLTVSAPNNFKILNGYTLAPDPAAANSELAALNFMARWDIGDQQTIDSLAARSYPDPLVLEYQIFQAMQPNSNSPALFDTVRLTITSADGLYVGCSDTAGFITNSGPMPLGSRMEAGGGGAAYTYYAEAMFSAPAALTGANLPTGASVGFFYPNIYFLNVKPFSVNGVPVNITASQYDSITLNDISKTEVSPPQSFIVSDPVSSASPEEVSLKASFVIPGLEIANYFGNRPYYLNDNVSVNLYICQNEGQMRGQFMTLDFSGRVAASVETPYDPAYGGRIYFSSANGRNPIAAQGYTDARSALRAGKVVRISGINLTPADLDSLINRGASINVIITLDGMDKNQKYFLCADIVLTGGAFGVQQASRTSSLAGITTISDLETPRENERIPSSPVLAVKEAGLSSATLTWGAVNPLSEDERIEYEIIRLKDVQMDPTMLASRIPFEAFYANSLPPGAQKAGWRTDRLEIEGYDGAAYTMLDETKAVYNPNTGPIAFTDYTLVPNQIYFYYVRTARVTGNSRIVSVWGRVSVTSKPVTSPKNLKTEQGADYRQTTETVFSFDAPIMDANLLGSAFNLQYQLQEGDGDWEYPVTMAPAALSGSSSSEPGYTRFVYKLTGLKPGTSYSLRVRMTDVNGEGSIYSNVIQIETVQ